MTACEPLYGPLTGGEVSVCPQLAFNAVLGLCGGTQPATQHSGRGLERRRSEMSKFYRLR